MEQEAKTITPEATTPSQPPQDHSKKQKRYPASPSLYELRKYFVYVIVGGLIISALIAIIAVLIGNMSGIIGKSVATVVTVIIHSIIALAFISTTSTKQPNRGSAVVINTLFGITVLSLITSMLSTWEIVTDGEFVLRQYLAYGAAFITSIIIYGLFQATEKDKATLMSRTVAIGSSLTSFVLLLPIIYDIAIFPDFYYRLLTAVNIVVSVSILITVIFHWYYISKHPELKDTGEKGEPLSVGKLIGRGFLILLLIWILIAVFGGMYRTLFPSHQSSPYPYRNYSSSRYY